MSRTIFVFGSNLAGRHGAGSAAAAVEHHGAVMGQGRGLQGDSYGIATKDFNLNTRPLHSVADEVDSFIQFARRHPDWTFNVVKIGCGLAGFSEDQIRPLFKDAPSNCNLPEGWR